MKVSASAFLQGKKPALKELLKKAEESDMPILKSYILQRLNDGEDTKQNFYI